MNKKILYISIVIVFFGLVITYFLSRNGSRIDKDFIDIQEKTSVQEKQNENSSGTLLQVNSQTFDDLLSEKSSGEIVADNGNYMKLEEKKAEEYTHIDCSTYNDKLQNDNCKKLKYDIEIKRLNKKCDELVGEDKDYCVFREVLFEVGKTKKVTQCSKLSGDYKQKCVDIFNNTSTSSIPNGYMEVPTNGSIKIKKISDDANNFSEIMSTSLDSNTEVNSLE